MSNHYQLQPYSSPPKTTYIGSYCFNRQDLLGSGSYSTVYLGYHISNPYYPVAIKEISMDRGSYIDEINLLESLRNAPFIIQLYDSFEDFPSRRVYLILEYCNQGSLADKRFSQISEVYRIFQQILQAMKTLRAQNIIHRDIKLANILLKNDGIRLCDFNLAKKLQSPFLCAPKCGTPSHLPPEILFSPHEQYAKFDLNFDVWALGVVLHQLAYGIPPRVTFSSVEVQKGFPLVDDFVRKSLRIYPEERMGWVELFEHPINFLSGDSEFEEWKRGKILKKFREFSMVFWGWTGILLVISMVFDNII